MIENVTAEGVLAIGSGFAGYVKVRVQLLKSSFED